jgi:hypothetical protein
MPKKVSEVQQEVVGEPVKDAGAFSLGQTVINGVSNLVFFVNHAPKVTGANPEFPTRNTTPWHVSIPCLGLCLLLPEVKGFLDPKVAGPALISWLEKQGEEEETWDKLRDAYAWPNQLGQAGICIPQFVGFPESLQKRFLV